MWGKLKRENITTIRLSDEELEAVNSLAKRMGISQSELWRRLLITVKVLYDGKLKLRDALKEDGELKGVHKILKRSDLTLARALKPIPEILRKLTSE